MGRVVSSTYRGALPAPRAASAAPAGRAGGSWFCIYMCVYFFFNNKYFIPSPSPQRSARKQAGCASHARMCTTAIARAFRKSPRVEWNQSPPPAPTRLRVAGRDGPSAAVPPGAEAASAAAT